MKNYIYIAIFAIAAPAAFIFLSQPKKENPLLEVFAKCLSEKRIVMYGANWCSHCQNEKKAFGDSFQFVSYVECPDNPQQCLAAGISGYPTWIFPNGKKLECEQGLEKLSRESGCLLEN